MTSTTPIPPGTEAVWQAPYNLPETVTVLKVQTSYRSGGYLYSVRCTDGVRFAQHRDLTPAPGGGPA